MEKSAKKSENKEKQQPREKTEEKEKPGFSEDVDFKRFLGCGG